MPRTAKSVPVSIPAEFFNDLESLRQALNLERFAYNPMNRSEFYRFLMKYGADMVKYMMEQEAMEQEAMEND